MQLLQLEMQAGAREKSEVFRNRTAALNVPFCADQLIVSGMI